MKEYLIYIIIGVLLFIVACIAIIWYIHVRNKPPQPFHPGWDKDPHTGQEPLEEKESELHVERLIKKEKEGFFCPLIQQNKEDNNHLYTQNYSSDLA